MSARTHLGLRIAGLFVLVALALLPRARDARHDHAVVDRAHTAHALELVSAKPAGSLSDDKPRPRTPRVVLDVIANVDESRLTN